VPEKLSRSRNNLRHFSISENKIKVKIDEAIGRAWIQKAILAWKPALCEEKENVKGVTGKST